MWLGVISLMSSVLGIQCDLSIWRLVSLKSVISFFFFKFVFALYVKFLCSFLLAFLLGVYWTSS